MKINPEMLNRETPHEMRQEIAHLREALEKIAEEEYYYQRYADGVDYRTCRYCETWLDEDEDYEEHQDYCPTRIAREALRRGETQ